MSVTQSLSDRLKFMQLDHEAQRNIRSVKDVVMGALPAALDKFYAQIDAFPETRRFFGSKTQIDAAKGRQLSHWDTISDGKHDQAYVNAVTAVGQVHARIGLEPRWYIGGYAVLLDALIGAVVKARWSRGGFGARRGADAQTVAAELGALAKATLLDMDFAISVYLEEAEAARLKAEAEVLAKERQTVVAAVGRSMAALAQGDLAYRMPDDIPAEYLQLREDFNGAMAALQETMTAVSLTTRNVRGGADEISAASDDLSRRTEQQAANLEQTAAALDQTTATVKRSADGARRANAVAAGASADAVKSREVMTEAVAAMSDIQESSNKISQIIGVIEEISFQTNLLALNAGVEAARAGDAGRGFAVVAQEVRALAQRSSDAAKEIKSLIHNSSEQVRRGVRLVGDTGQALSAIVANVAEIDTLISEIAHSAQEQASGLTEVNTAVNQMDQVTQQNAAMVEEATAAAANLRSEANALARLVARFETDAVDDGPAQPRLADPGRHPPVRNPVARVQARLATAMRGRSAPAPATDSWEEF